MGTRRHGYNMLPTQGGHALWDIRLVIAAAVHLFILTEEKREGLPARDLLSRVLQPADEHRGCFIAGEAGCELAGGALPEHEDITEF